MVVLDTSAVNGCGAPLFWLAGWSGIPADSLTPTLLVYPIPMAKTILKGEALLEVLQRTDRNRYVKWLRPGLDTERISVGMALSILKASLDMYEGKASLTRVYSLRDLTPAPQEEKPGPSTAVVNWWDRDCIVSWRAQVGPVLQPAAQWFQNMGYNRARCMALP